MTVKTLVMPELGRFVVEHRPDRAPTGHQVAIEVRSVGICGSDVTYFRSGRIGPWTVEGPIVLGHEAAGVVSAVGPEVSRVSIGDRVAVEPGTPCRRCRLCRRGNYHLCPELVFLATPPYDGALAEYVVLDENCAHPIPDTMSFDDAALVEPLSVGVWAAQRASLQPGDDVLVTGAGPVGLLAGLAAQALGGGRVTITDVVPERLELASSLGLRAREPGGGGEREVDVLIECSGNEPALVAGLRRLRAGGRAALVGVPKTELVGLPLAEAVPREISVSLVHRYAHTWPIGIELISSGRVPTAGLVTHHFPLAEGAEAFALHDRPQSAVKIMIHPTEG